MKYFFPLIVLGFAIILFLSCADNSSLKYPNADDWFQYGEMTDGEHKYKTIVIGKQTWMAQNLNTEVAGSECYYDDTINCGKYGRLYDFETANEICPDGWHLPDTLEWKTLIAFVGSQAGTKLKAVDGWEYKGTNDFGFAALSSGYRKSDGEFTGIGEYGGWWSSDEEDDKNAFVRYIFYDNEIVSEGDYDKNCLFSVRCLKNKD